MDGEDREDESFMTSTDAMRHLRTAYQYCWDIVHFEGSESSVPWMKRHTDFVVSNKLSLTRGFGEGLFTQQGHVLVYCYDLLRQNVNHMAIFNIRLNLEKRFLRKKDPNAVYSLHNVIIVSNEGLTQQFIKTSGLAENYISNVLTKEAMVIILQEATGINYHLSNQELEKTEGRNLTTANRLIMKYFEKEQADFFRKHSKK
ncbi:uncharacterized protein LOC132723279 [Ruditapes philippinarum]|uniref:uncharacterized protein LOC132723279 n=1 Tax=Ruditapes philippinarum TaxID=129788 RepID=UPI00295A9BEE|nr:uncharacterized protein LOC132723279 [Ruditapes philippinarum]